MPLIESNQERNIGFQCPATFLCGTGAGLKLHKMTVHEETTEFTLRSLWQKQPLSIYNGILFAVLIAKWHKS